MYTALRAIIHRPANLASVADEITCLIMCAMLRMAPLFCGMVLLFERKKCPQALLRAFVSLRQLALLCAASTILLAMNVSTASSCVPR
jgi:hypothetical protein